MLIYKLFSEKDYKKFLDESSFEGSASDSEDGFIHLSTRSQSWATVYKHFNDERNLYISAFNFNSSDPNLKWDVSRNDEYFPHYYGKLLLRDYVYSIKIIN